MSYLDDPTAGMTTVHAQPGDAITLCLDNVDLFPIDMYRAIVECAAFVNWRCVEAGLPGVLTLAFYKSTSP